MIKKMQTEVGRYVKFERKILFGNSFCRTYKLGRRDPESKAHVLMVVTEKSKLIVSYVYRLLNVEHMNAIGF